MLENYTSDDINYENDLQNFRRTEKLVNEQRWKHTFKYIAHNLTTDVIDEYENFDFVKYGYGEELFPGFGKTTRKFLFTILCYLNTFVGPYISQSIFCLYIIGIITNIVHLNVLTRKSMRNNSINIFLLSIAINDICLPVSFLFQNLAHLVNSKSYKISKNDYVYISKFSFISFCSHSILRRNSSCFPVLLAGTRAVTMRNFDKSRFKYLITGKFGVLSVTSWMGINILLAIFLFFILIYLNETDCGAFSICDDLPNDFNETSYYRILQNDFQTHENVVYIIQFIPSLFYPYLTYSLFKGIQKAHEYMRTIEQRNRNDRITRVTITMTVFFMIAEIPQAMGWLMEANFKSHVRGLSEIGSYIFILFYNISLINSISHLFICLKISSEYRTSFWELIGQRITIVDSNALGTSQFLTNQAAVVNS